MYPDVKNLPLTYLADPMAAGVVFFLDNKSDSLPGWKTGEAKYCSFYSDEAITENTARPISKEEWLAPKSFRVQLKEGNQSSEWDMAERKLVVYLNKGITATLNYASFWRPQDILGKSGLYQILGKKTDSKADPGKMLITLGNARKGKHWMISP
ncbi:MAG: hypothetical protein IPP73_12820 [Chitinophagaceae bacterium]|nr:hypothetical protein [Chitinophagaceae bacterium]